MAIAPAPPLAALAEGLSNAVIDAKTVGQTLDFLMGKFGRPFLDAVIACCTS